MKLLMLFNCYRKDEGGAVTVDWVVLTAAIVGLGLVVISSIAVAISSNATTIAGDVTTAVISGPSY